MQYRFAVNFGTLSRSILSLVLPDCHSHPNLGANVIGDFLFYKIWNINVCFKNYDGAFILGKKKRILKYFP